VNRPAALAIRLHHRHPRPEQPAQDRVRPPTPTPYAVSPRPPSRDSSATRRDNSRQWHELSGRGHEGCARMAPSSPAQGMAGPRITPGTSARGPADIVVVARQRTRHSRTRGLHPPPPRPASPTRPLALITSLALITPLPRRPTPDALRPANHSKLHLGRPTPCARHPLPHPHPPSATDSNLILGVTPANFEGSEIGPVDRSPREGLESYARMARYPT
jgi:hypothetical protein